MRFLLVGIVCLSMCGSAFGQAQGFVEKIGFGKQYRPYGWTPLLVNLTSTIGEPAEYQIQVRQEDLDRDRVIFRRDIVLNPGRQEQFWVYFMAQPRGLPNGSAPELDKALDVRLCTKSGKPLVKLGIQDPIMSLDPARGFGVQRGLKLVLMVTDGISSSSTPAVREFNGAIGLNEDLASVLLTPFDLPENVIGYDAVDAVVWLDADSGKMTSGGSRRLAALTDYVRGGGRLVVCQPTELFKLEAMSDLLPVQLKDAGGDWLLELRDKSDLDPIRRLAQLRTGDANLREQQEKGWNAIEARGPFKVAYATLRNGAVGEEWIDWKGDASEHSPWIARWPIGLGSVTWVAQDLGNPVITGRGAMGWPRVWDKVLGQRNIDMRVPIETDGVSQPAERARTAYYTTSAVDLGASFLRGMEHEGRAGGLVFLAGVFFVGYWVLAGPVAYLILASRKRTELSWTIFAVSAMAATLLTVGVVRLVLRGDAAVHHVSLVRMLAPERAEDGSPISHAIVNSRIGLYIPRDGMQRVTLLGNDPQALSYVTPFSVHPAHQSTSTEFPAYLEYEIPVRDNPLTEPVSIRIPYRSTLKKLEARWVGHLNGGIDISTIGGSYEHNKPRLVPLRKETTQPDATGTPQKVRIGTINGRLVNRTGADLAHVYFAFNYPQIYQGGPDFDFVLYVPAWPKDAFIDLARAYNDAARLTLPRVTAIPGSATPGGGNKLAIHARIDDWAAHWTHGLRPTAMSDQVDDSRNEFLRSFPMLSLYERLPPQRNQQNAGERVEILRRAARDWDASELVAAGQLVILAQAGKPGATSDHSPLPFPAEVEGERVHGTGTTFYQVALPLDRSELPAPWSTDDENEANDTPAEPAESSLPPVEKS